jgi:hypothetical protein
MSHDHTHTQSHTYLTSERDKHGEILLVVPDDHTVAEQFHLVHHFLLDGGRGDVLPSPRYEDLLDTTSDVQVPWVYGKYELWTIY